MIRLRKYVYLFNFLIVIGLLAACTPNHREKIFVNNITNISWEESFHKISTIIGADVNNIVLQEFLISWKGMKTEDIDIVIINKLNHQGYTIAFRGESSEYTYIENQGEIKNLGNLDNPIYFKDIIDILNAHNMRSLIELSDMDKDFMMLSVTNGNVSYINNNLLLGKLYKVNRSSIDPFKENESLNLPNRTVSFNLGSKVLILDELSN